MKNLLRRKLPYLLLSALMLGLIPMAAAGCSNARTPAGHEGYVLHEPLFLGKRTFVNSQRGPTSTGLKWRQQVINIDMRPKTYSEDYKILTQDNLNLSFQSHAKISLKPNSVRQVVEQTGGAAWHADYVQQQYRSEVRTLVRAYKAYEVKEHSGEIASKILEDLRGQFEATPIVFESISIGNIDYPDKVNEEIELRLAAEQHLQRMDAMKRIAQQEAEIKITEAKGLADAQKIIDDTLTPLYIQHEAIDAYKQLANSEDTTFIIAPTSSNGTGIPVILGSNK